jgi:DNA-binding transcriptional ArsR family regulator
MKTNQIIDLLSGLAQESRLLVFRELVKAHAPGDCGGLPAGELAKRVGIPNATLSFHLKEMFRAGLVTSRKQGRSVIYKANLESMQNLCAYLLEDCCGGNCDVALTKTQKLKSKQT